MRVKRLMTKYPNSTSALASALDYLDIDYFGAIDDNVDIKLDMLIRLTLKVRELESRFDAANQDERKT